MRFESEMIGIVLLGRGSEGFPDLLFFCKKKLDRLRILYIMIYIQYAQK